MSLACFIVAFAMLTYDWLGHVCCFIARRLGSKGRPFIPTLWNNHSHRIWPRLSPTHYDIHWSLWHGTTLALFTVAYVRAGT